MLDPTLTTQENLLENLESITEAAQAVVDNWESGDLAAAVTELGQRITAAREVAADIRKLATKVRPTAETDPKVDETGHREPGA